MTKICNTCGREVDDNSNFCGFCKGRSFRPKSEIITPNDDIVHKMFYWQYPQGAMLSKSKVGSAIVFTFTLVLALALGSNPIAAIVVAAIFGAVTLLSGILAHKVLPEPPVEKIRHNDYGLLQDLKYLFFYWQDKSGGYIFSKTKVISFIIFLIMFGVGLTVMTAPVVLGAIFFAFLFETPIFFIGYGLHKLTSKDTSNHVIPTKKPKQIKKAKEPKKLKTDVHIPKVIPEYMDYRMQIDELNSRFQSKENSTRNLIAKRFEPPQLTYTRFIGGVDRSRELFEKQRDSAMTMISLADEYSSRVSSEIESKIEIMKSIISKLDALSNELLLNEDISQSDDVDNLVEDMDNLIRSVKDYDNQD